MGQVSDDFDVGVIVGIDFSGQEIDVNDYLVRSGIPELGMVLHHVVAERDDHVGHIDGAGYGIL